MTTPPGARSGQLVLAVFVGSVALLASAAIAAIVTIAVRIAALRSEHDPAFGPQSYWVDARFRSPGGTRVAAIAKRGAGGKSSGTLAISLSGGEHQWSVPYDWSRFEIADVRWIDDATLEFSGTELVRGTVRDRIELDLDGSAATRTTLVCRQLREAWRE